MRSKKNSTLLIFGSIAGICLILVVAATWLAGPAAFLGWPIWLGRSLVILIAAVAAIVEKRRQGGSLTFRPALQITYGVMAAALVVQSLFVWLILNVFDPGFYGRLVPVIVANTQSTFHRMGATDEQLRQALDDIRTNNQFSVGSMTRGTAFELVIFFVIAVLIAATVKSGSAPTPAPKQS